MEERRALAGFDLHEVGQCLLLLFQGSGSRGLRCRANPQSPQADCLSFRHSTTHGEVAGNLETRVYPPFDLQIHHRLIDTIAINTRQPLAISGHSRREIIVRVRIRLFLVIVPWLPLSAGLTSNLFSARTAHFAL